MPKLTIKTLNGIQVLESPPNGGWAWVVMPAGFILNGISWGTAKTLGAYFLDIQNEFSVSNAAVSWLISFVISILMFSGLFAKLVMMRWFDPRQLVILGGFLSATGMVIMSLSPQFSVLYFGAILAGIGYGFATFVATSQISMYFSSLRPLANGVVTSGSPVLSIIFPYLARDFMEKYGWRGSFLITGAISLNMSVFGSLIRPISAISNQCKRLKSADGEMCETDFTTNDEHHLNATTSLRKLERNTAETTQKKKNRSFTSFLRQYSLAFAFLFVNFLFAQCMYNPNVFIVPYAAQLGFTELESTLLLSFISVGDFLGRLGSGLIASKFNFSLNCSLLVISSCALLLAALQLAPLFHPTFPVLMMYVTIYGLAFGGVVTLTFSVIGQSMNVKTVEIAMATLFFSHGIAVLVGGPMAGFIVDKCRGFKAVFWYTFISGSLSGSLYFFLSYLVRQLGSLILENGKQKIAASECNHNI